MPKLTIRCSDDFYQLLRGHDESDECEYGDPCVLESGGKTYLALVCEDDQGERFSYLSGDDWAVEVKGGVDVEFEDTEPETEIENEPELEETDDDAGDGDIDEADEPED